MGWWALISRCLLRFRSAGFAGCGEMPLKDGWVPTQQTQTPVLSLPSSANAMCWRCLARSGLATAPSVPTLAHSPRPNESTSQRVRRGVQLHRFTYFCCFYLWEQWICFKMLKNKEVLNPKDIDIEFDSDICQISLTGGVLQKNCFTAPWR